jgi:hypothetical protein
VSVVVIGSTPTIPAPEIAAFLGTLAHGGTVELASERKVITLPAAVLARYAGVYELGGPMTFVVDSAQLAMVNGPDKTPLLAASETSFYLQGTNLRIEFVSDASGTVTEVVFQQGTRQDRGRRVTGR